MGNDRAYSRLTFASIRGFRSLRDAPAGVPAPQTLVRFSAATRLFHWLNALFFLFLLVTGLLILLVPEVKALHIGGHRVVALLHVLAGIAFIAAVPLVYLLVRGGSASAGLRHDLRLALTPEPGDGAWLRHAVRSLLGAREPEPPAGKYNAGQKLSSAFWVLATAGLMATGAVLAVNYFTKRVFGAAFVEGVFPWHDALTLVALPMLAGHLYLALLNPSTRPSLRGILTGRVGAAWARRHHPRWAEEEERSRESTRISDANGRE